MEVTADVDANLRVSDTVVVGVSGGGGAGALDTKSAGEAAAEVLVPRGGVATGTTAGGRA